MHALQPSPARSPAFCSGRCFPEPTGAARPLGGPPAARGRADRASSVPVARAGGDVRARSIRLVDFSSDTPLDVPQAARDALEELLRNPTFCAQVARDTAQAPGTEVEYAELLFQPVPWSPTTTKGMPAALEQYHDDPAYVTINVPPNFLFQAKIFKPSRLCAIYRKRA